MIDDPFYAGLYCGLVGGAFIMWILIEVMLAMIYLLEVVKLDDLHEYLSNIDMESDRYPL